MRYRSATVADSHGLPRCLGGEKNDERAECTDLPQLKQRFLLRKSCEPRHQFQCPVL